LVEEKERYLAETVGDFLAHMPQVLLAIPREGVIQSLRDLIATTTDGNMAAFARNIGRPKTSLWELVQGYFPPSLPFVLQLCYQFHLPLLPFLLGGEQVAPGESPVSQEQTPKRDARCPVDRENVKQALEAILADQQSVPLSMREVARRLDYPVRTIETHFPYPAGKFLAAPQRIANNKASVGKLVCGSGLPRQLALHSCRERS